MKTRLDESLTGAAGSYILPFFWQHGEDVQLLSSGSVLQVGGLNLACLILPYAQRLPFAFLQRLAGLAENGFPILFLEALPESSCSGENCGALLKRLAQSALVLPLHELASYLMEKKLPILSSASGSLYPDLRAYQYEGDGCGCVMLMNEHISSAVHDEIWFTDFEPEWDFECGDEIEQMKDVCIYLDGANEITSVRLNGGEPVTRIGTPYRFPVGESIRLGHNHLVVENVTTVFPHVKDHPSINTPLHSMGLCGKVWMEWRRG